MGDENLDNFEELAYDDDNIEIYDSRCESELGSDGESERFESEKQKVPSKIARARRVPMTPIQEKEERSAIRSPLKQIQSTPKSINISKTRRNLTGEFGKVNENEKDFKNRRDDRGNQQISEISSQIGRELNENTDIVPGNDERLYYEADQAQIATARQGVQTMDEEIRKYQDRFGNLISETQDDAPSKAVRFDVPRTESTDSLITSQKEDERDMNPPSVIEKPKENIAEPLPNFRKPSGILKSISEIVPSTSGMTSIIHTPEWQRRQKILDERYQRMCQQQIQPLSLTHRPSPRTSLPAETTTPKRPIGLRTLNPIVDLRKELGQQKELKDGSIEQKLNNEDLSKNGLGHENNQPSRQSSFRNYSNPQKNLTNSRGNRLTAENLAKHQASFQQQSQSGDSSRAEKDSAHFGRDSAHLERDSALSTRDSAYFFTEDLLKPRRKFTEKTDQTQTERTSRSPISQSDTMRTAISRAADSSFPSRAPSAMSQMNQTITMCELSASSGQLAFGFVDVKVDKILPLTLTNNGNESANFTLRIKYPSDYKGGQVFNIVHVTSTTLRGHGGQATFSVGFHPLAQASYTAELIVKRTNCGESEFRFPIFGYGGRCHVEAYAALGERLMAGLEGLRVVNVDSRQSTYHFSLRNDGVRSAFCAIFALNENNEILNDGPVKVTPQRTIIQKSQMINCKVELATDSLRRSHSAQSLSSTKTVNDGILKLLVYYGEERQRLRFKQYLAQHRKRYICYKVDFAVQFEGESARPMKMVYRADVEAFKDCIRTLRIEFNDPRRVTQRPVSRAGTSMSMCSTIADETLLQRTYALPVQGSPFRTPRAQPERDSILADNTVIPTVQRAIRGPNYEMVVKSLLTLVLLIQSATSIKRALYKDGDTYNLPPQRKFCLGTTNGRTAAGALPNETRYEVLLKSFVRCKRIIGNLEISHISHNDTINDVDIRIDNGTQIVTRRKPFWFLHDLEEITGYILIYNVEIKEIAFPSLKIIWGDKLHEGQAIQLDSNPFLTIVNLPQLREVHHGTIQIRRCPRLCFIRKTVDFGELLGSGSQFRVRFIDEVPPVCPPVVECHPSCNGNCFGPTENQCQTVYRRQCSACSSGQCYHKAGVTHCCDEACLGGCFGDGKDQCVACLDYQEDGRCVTECRGTSRYNSSLMIMQPMPDREKRYYYEKHCVQQCPAGTLIEDRYCVARCSEGKYRDPSGDERHCVPCDGPCPKVCVLTESIDSHNIHQLANCSEIEGNLEILNYVFSPHLPHMKTSQMDKVRPSLVEPLKIQDLNVLKSVKIVTGHVALDGGVKRGSDGPRSLDFLENLEVIEGRTLYFEKYSFYVIGNDNMHALGLKSLRKIANGGISLTKNKNLCFGQTIPYKELFGVKDVVIKENMNQTTCENLGRVCDPTCHPEFGCWGPGPSQCVKCLNFTKDGYCSDKCPTHDGYFISRTDPSDCRPCADECLRCQGPTDSDCLKCRWFEMPKLVGNQLKCVRQCPADTFQHLNRCVKCAPACYQHGCTGNGTHLGAGGCNKCLFAIRNTSQVECLEGETEESVCKENGFVNYHLSLGSLKEKNTKFMCEKCPEECSSCTRSTIDANDCECSKYRLVTPKFQANETIDLPDECTLTCGHGSRIIVNATDKSPVQICERCNDLCDPDFSCTGPSQFECDQCRVGGVRTEDDVTECLPKCPDYAPFTYQGMCVTEDTEAILARRRNFLIGAVVAGFIVASTVILILVSRCMKYRKKYEKEALMHMPEIPELDRKKLTQRPNMGRFTLISTDELDDPGRNVLGQGAFGIVYAGKWKPAGHSMSIPVAIKAINPSETKNVTENEMLKEAGVMGKVRHEHLLPLVGVCLAKGGLKIITILRPLGSLLKFLQQYKQRLAAKQLVLYQYQISSAMEYLAKKKIVHRDLAARNVLVKTINHVEVTDFGLAQLLQNNENTVVIKEGRVAVKWLALESLRTHVFNERTDVWAFGVTCWEIMTFGEPPYRELQAILQPIANNYNFATEFANLLEKGHRLKQPLNCSQELYEELLNCWLIDPESRPTFRELKTKFESFARAPHLYVQDRQAVSQMESISEQEQRAMIERMLQDSDFENPLELDPSDYGPIKPNRHSENTEETFLPDTPTSSHFGNRNPFGTDRSISVGSRLPRVSDANSMEDEYLQPKNALEPTENGTVYTPVIVNSNPDSPSHDYLNDPYQKLLKTQQNETETAF